MDDLVRRLAEGNHPVVASRAEGSIKELAASIQRGLVHIEFTDTEGGTELGVRLDKELSDLNRADFESGQGIVRLVGNLTLNFVPVRCLANIDLSTLEGEGHLELLEQPTSLRDDTE